ncbi:MAG TPA: hypothetical protein VN958_16100, partial [Chitinophagaceae bacterium]|nr:hypothetical protein [Chitinophagaceae bacterium]
MKKFIVVISIVGFFSGCFKDTCINSFKIYLPVYKSLTQVRADMKSLAAQPIQHTGKMFVYGKYIFLNEPDKGIHVIDNTDPAVPVNLSFIHIPGNVDIAVKGNYLYADSYSDLVVFDISNATDIRAIQFLNNV